MINGRFLGVCLVLILGLLGSSFQDTIFLDCGDDIFIDEDVVVKYPVHNSYGNNENCQWNFQSSAEMELQFTKIDLETPGQGCYDFLTIKTAERVINNLCRFTETKILGNHIQLLFRSDSSNTASGFQATIKLTDPRKFFYPCDFGTGFKGSVLSYYKFAPPSLGLWHDEDASERHYDFEGKLRTRITSVVGITIGADAGSSVCYGNNVMMPTSDTPSCHADAPGKCRWTTTGEHIVIPKNNLNYKIFALEDGHCEFETRNVPRRLNRACLYIEYFARESGQLSLLGSNGISNVTLQTFNYTQDIEWKMVKLVASLPASLRNNMTTLKLRFKSNSPGGCSVYVKKLYGCNPHSMDNRFLLSTSPDNLTLITSYADHESGSDVECLHGGVPGNDTTCRCPAGLMGNHCEQTCDPNKFGKNCEAICSSESEQCERMVFCVPGVGCRCMPGWTGSRCHLACSDGLFGISCGGTCGHCKDGRRCDRYSGKCIRGCQPGYIPPFCLLKLAHLTKAAEVIKYNLTWAEISVKFTDEEVSGSGVPPFFIVQYRQSGTKDWLDEPPFFIGGWNSSSRSISHKIEGLKPGTAYQGRILLLSHDFAAYEGSDLPVLDFKTDCKENPINISTSDVTENSFIVSWQFTNEGNDWCKFDDFLVEVSSGYNDWKRFENVATNRLKVNNLVPSTDYIVAFSKLQSNVSHTPVAISYVTTLPYQAPIDLEVYDVGYRSLRARWNARSNASTFYLHVKCPHYLMNSSDHYGNCSNEHPVMMTDVTGSEFYDLLVENLHPFTRYTVAVGYSQMGEPSEVQVTTKFAIDGPGLEVRLVNVTQTSLLIEWKPINECPVCSLFTDGYMVVITGKYNGTLEMFTRNNQLYLDLLVPAYNYTINVYYVNNQKMKISDGAELEVQTKASVPSPVKNLVAYKKGRTMVGLRWSTPDLIYGSLESFVVSYPHGDVVIKPPQKCSFWPNFFCHTIEGLQPDTIYKFTVAARNDALDENGDPNDVTAETVESSPEAPMNLSVEGVAETNLNISWCPPNMLNGVLRSFLIKIEQIDSYVPSFCCNYYPKVEVRAEEERERFETQISGLTSGSTYALSIMAETAWLGPAARIEVSTRPPPPLAVNLPERVIFHDTKEPIDITWQSQGPSQLNSSAPQVHQNLLLLVPAINDSDVQGVGRIKSADLLQLLVEAVGDKFDILAEYQQGEGVVVHKVGTDEYRFVAVSVVKYREVYNMKTLSSQPVRLM